MKQAIKTIVKAVLFHAGIDITKNQQYDRQTLQIMKKVIKPGSNCVDVGCHKGEMLETILKLAPAGHHYAFEPIPPMYEALLKKFSGQPCKIYPYALDTESGTATFNYVVNDPAYSGLQQRKYDIARPQIQEITVQRERLDDVLPADAKIDFIKIDVEGGEFNVLKGAKNLITRNKPVIIFECGLGASEYYGTKSSEIFQFISETLGLKIYVMKDWLKGQPALTAQAFNDQYEKRLNYYFVAVPA